MFQSTLPRVERPFFLRNFQHHRMFQSTLPRGERQGELKKEISWFAVSIHAPAWGATQLLANWQPSSSVSIHAPAWGATRDRPPNSSSGAFQSTLPRGERRMLLFIGQIQLWFQSTLPRGERLNKPMTNDQMRKFQSTLPRGERPYLANL